MTSPPFPLPEHKKNLEALHKKTGAPISYYVNAGLAAIDLPGILREAPAPPGTKPVKKDRLN